MSANTLKVRGFINKIDLVEGKEGADDKYFAKVGYSEGDSDNRFTQYISCFVSKSLNNLAKSAYESQTEIEKGKFNNVLGSQVAEILIIKPTFRVNDQGYLNGSGILTSISFITPELNPNSK